MSGKDKSNLELVERSVEELSLVFDNVLIIVTKENDKGEIDMSSHYKGSPYSCIGMAKRWVDDVFKPAEPIED